MDHKHLLRLTIEVALVVVLQQSYCAMRKNQLNCAPHPAFDADNSRESDQ
jgi:hypothetical protein